jgi:hypothetical protein
MQRKFLWGILFIIVGVTIWASNLNYIPFNLDFSRNWPIILIAIGVVKLIDFIKFSRRKKGITS